MAAQSEIHAICYTINTIFVAATKRCNNLYHFFTAEIYLLYGSLWQSIGSLVVHVLQLPWADVPRAQGAQSRIPWEFPCRIRPLKPWSTCLTFLSYRVRPLEISRVHFCKGGALGIPICCGATWRFLKACH